MKQTLLMVLALGMYCIDVSAQTTRECIVEDDGFEWYKTSSKKDGKDFFGAEDRYGNIILPCVFRNIKYDPYTEFESFSWGAGFKVWKPYKIGMTTIERDSHAYYLRNGKCIIPFSRGLFVDKKKTERNFGTYYVCTKLANGTDEDFRRVICDINGKEIITFNNIDYRHIDDVLLHKKKNIFFIEFTSYHLSDGYGYGIADGNGKIIVEPKSGQTDVYLSEDGLSFGFVNSAGKWISLASVSSMSTKSNPLAENPEEDPEATKFVSTTRPNNNSSSSNISSSSSSGSSSNSNSGNNTTTIHVEHHRDPVPVQEWVQCTSCWGSGNCRNCAGSGTTYIGSNLHRCSMCGGRGRCTTCSGQGGRYYTVYK